jgi:hypothetical protein
MDLFRKLGGIFVRHYEKVLLVLVLIGLVASVGLLIKTRQDEEEKIRDYDQKVLKGKTKELPAVDLGVLTGALEAAKNPPALNFGLPHNLFNPVKWQKRPDGSVLPIRTGTEIGGAALKIAAIAPLNTMVTLDKSTGTGLQMSALQEAHTNRQFWVKWQSFVKSNEVDRTKLFTLREMRGTLEKPEAVIEVGAERVTVTPEKPFTRVDGYKVDLTYPPDPRLDKMLKGKRVGDVLSLGNEDYIIVAIKPNEIVVSARSNNRLTTIRNNAP